ncbi:hypothetical protein GCM10010218_24510 [Streptomyces mashuensis]|uniref:Uncharacterized protein n=1 Tax=Streptomyces mashuensis TaxID=33904 RepID=A0A919ECM6_9ACTN|nr:hypothetical protein [Streptomyces mashuensis]GHF42460.1 hypothetical protein GCM10010218_24510 [Streptomyces mashuensis]
MTRTDPRRRIAALQRAHDELLGAARSAVTAYWDGDTEPLSLLIDTLDRLGALPEYAPQLTDQALDALAAADTPLVGRRIA